MTFCVQRATLYSAISALRRFLVAGVFYLLMTLVLTYGFNKLERKYSRYD